MSLRSFVQELAGLEVPGVKTRLQVDQTPEGTVAAKLPLQYVELPSGDSAPITLDNSQWWPTYRADVVILVAPVGKAEWGKVADRLLTLMDALVESVQAWTNQEHSSARVQVSVSSQVLDVSGVQYFAAVGEVTYTGEN